MYIKKITTINEIPPKTNQTEKKMKKQKNKNKEQTIITCNKVKTAGLSSRSVYQAK